MHGPTGDPMAELLLAAIDGAPGDTLRLTAERREELRAKYGAERARLVVGQDEDGTLWARAIELDEEEEAAVGLLAGVMLMADQLRVREARAEQLRQDGRN